MEASTTVAVRDAVDPRIQRLRELCAGEGLPEQTWEPPGRPLGITIDVTNTGRLLALLDELEREDAS
ncbi:MAG: hypothetical protein ACKVVT_11880 [Dehalococcoidia bacterium]